jgi:hypothetical protein
LAEPSLGIMELAPLMLANVARVRAVAWTV